MSGHSKWKNIMHKKEKTDAQKAKVFTKVGKEIAVAVKEGGPDPASNTKLRDLISKAKSLNVPNDNIDRIIKKASSNDAADYEVIYYEGYGPSGIAVMVEATTDNRNRTGAEVRHYFDKFGGNLGTIGCVSFMFDKRGVLIISSEDLPDEEAVMMDALDCGADDFTADEGFYEVLTTPESFSQVREALEQKGYSFETAEVQLIPQTTVTLTDEEDLKNINKLIDMLEDNDDVQNVYHNWEE